MTSSNNMSTETPTCMHNRMTCKKKTKKKGDDYVCVKRALIRRSFLARR
jgi:hypothetical protein